MSREYRIIEEVADPITPARGVQGVTYDEAGEIELANGERRRCKVLEIDGGNTMAQLYEASIGINLDSNKVRFLGRTVRSGVSEDMLSHVFDGMGKPINGGPGILPEKRMGTNGLSMSPAARSYPEESIQASVSAIDGLNILVRGQKLPIFSASGPPHANLAAQVTRQTEVCGVDESFAVMPAVIGITFEEVSFFMESFRETGAIDRDAMLINLANDPAVERITTPRIVLTATEYLALGESMHILVILIDVTNYANSLRKISAAREEVPGRRGYPGYMYTDLTSPYGRAGRQRGKNGSITMIPVLAIPEDDKTYPIPGLTSYTIEGQTILGRELYRKDVTPPIDVLSSLSRPRDKGIGEGKIRADHTDAMNRLFAAYVHGKDAREPMIILGEAALTDMDKLYAGFADEFEKEYVSQGYYVDYDVEETMEIGWRLLCILPGSELKRIKDKLLGLYYEVK